MEEAKKKKAEPAKESVAQGFFAGVRREFNRIMWPTREEVGKQTFAVLVLSVIIGVFIMLLDSGFSTLFHALFGIG